MNSILQDIRSLVLDRLADESGPVRVRLECTVAELRQLVSPTGLVEGRCALLPMAGHSGLRLPTVPADQQLSVENTPGQDVTSTHHAILAQPELVPGGNGDGYGLSPDTAPASGSADIPAGGEPSLNPEQQHSDGCVEALRRGFTDQGLSTAAGDLIVAGNRPTTRAAYKSVFNIWKDWCAARGTDPLSCSLNTALEFLTEQFDEGKSSSIEFNRH